MIQKFSFNLGAATLSRLITGGIGLVVTSLLTRNLGPVAFGQYSSIFAYLYVFASLADLGLYTVLTREISKPGADEAKIASSIFTLRLIFIIGFILLAGALLIFVPYVLQIKIGILICSLFYIFSSLAQVLTGIFQKHLELYWVSLSDVISRIIQLGILIVLVNIEASLMLFIWAVVISEFFHFLLIFKFSNGITKIKLSFDWSYWKNILPTALPIAISSVFVLIYFKLDTVLLSIMKPAYDVGVYSLPYKLLEALIFLPAMFIGLVLPILSRNASLDLQKFKKNYQKAFDVISIFAFPLFVYLVIMSDKVVRLVGGTSFAQSGDVLRILSIAIALIFFGNLSGSALIALDLQKRAMWIYFLGAVISIVGNIILIPRFSFFATAWVTVITEFIITLLTFWIISRKIDYGANLKIFFRAAMASVVLIFLLLPFRNNLILGSVVALFYFPTLYLFRGFTKEEIKEAILFKKPAILPEEN